MQIVLNANDRIHSQPGRPVHIPSRSDQVMSDLKRQEMAPVEVPSKYFCFPCQFLFHGVLHLEGWYTRSTPLQNYASQEHMIYASAGSWKQGAMRHEVNQYESNPTYLNYRPSDRRLLTKLVPTFVDRGCRVVSATDPHGPIFGFLDRSRYFVLPSSSSIVLTRLSGPRSRPTASREIWQWRESNPGPYLWPGTLTTRPQRRSSTTTTNNNNNKKLNSMAWVRERTIPTERPLYNNNKLSKSEVKLSP
jgi:hypothetical protein